MMATILTIGVFGIAKLEDVGIIDKPVTQYVKSGKDFIAMKKWVASMIDVPNNESVQVNHEAREFIAYESMRPYEDGVIVSYPVPHAIEAQGSGLVIFTGITRQTGKTLTVLYDDGDEVTYGFVGKFTKLPYTSVKQGDTLAVMDEETIYLRVKRDGVNLASSLLPAYLSGTVE